jgi:phage FluMu gp28-like protein
MSRPPDGFPKRTRWSREFDTLHKRLVSKLGDGTQADIPEDPVQFIEEYLDYTPTSYQRELIDHITEGRKRIVLRWARQSGKSWILASLLIWHCARNPNHLALIVAPGLRQSMILRDKIHELLDKIPLPRRRAILRQRLRTTIKFRNGSQIVALPNSEHLLRGYTANLVICDEAAFFHNDETIFQHILTPMMATTNGTMIVSSTPWGQKTVYYQINQDPDWVLVHAPWTRALNDGIYDPEFAKEIDKIRQSRPQTYTMEYLAEFIEDIDTWLPQDLLAKSVRHDLEYTGFNETPTGHFYAGIDLAEKVDHTAIAVAQRTSTGIDLVHMHRFKLGTSLAAAIGYTKTLNDRWIRIHAAYIDKTKHGDYIIQDFREAGVTTAQGITFTQNSKMEMAQLLKQRLHEDALRIPYDRSLLDELNIEQYELTKTGKITYSHPEGTHDDRFWALALAIYASEQSKPSSRPIARTR